MNSAKVSQLQLLQQNLDALQMQEQQLSSQLAEIDSALTELKDSSNTYRIVGRIMIATSKDKAEKELTEEKKVMQARLKAMQEQQQKLKQNLEAMQKEVMEELQSE